MNLTHEMAVYAAKTAGLIWMLAFFLIVVLLAYRPSRKSAHERAARSVLIDREPRGKDR
ncbi:MAG: CcoQ/FixQ family Cbb3-type cytochrome c oxidase assembly chaperone [Bauldia sp.]|uniref:cbb3-type cytochrome oxidase subunit 3 n=1 Tax=Bauldia sp. TaxID=2575872 RepID=UPI001DEE11E1|nr:cbb3-type cytochrome c oxidase subunit 3 [Bauldia sp.]MCB1494318.1 CcoQ/FixQ family Cbb3-type cytochrome c oxidase assembly chaperone [Bauldia sp.]